MAITYQDYHGKFTIGNSAKDFTIESEANSLTTGNYYICGYTSESTLQLCEHLQAVIRASNGAAAKVASATVTYSFSTGLITIDFPDGDGDMDIVWTDTALRDILGFTGDLSGADSYTATYQPRYVWRPTLNLARYPTVDLTNTFFAPRPMTRYSRSVDGTTTSVVRPTLYDGEYSYFTLPESDVITTSSTTAYQTFEYFFNDVIANGMPIRVYPDRTAYTSSDVFEAMWATGEDGAPVGPWQDYCDYHVDRYRGLCDLRFSLNKYVA